MDNQPNPQQSKIDLPAILMPLPDRDFDLTEAAVPWKVCRDRGWQVTISTEAGNRPQADLHKLSGPLPGLLSASQAARAAYAQMKADAAFNHPIPYSTINPAEFAALLLPGGDGLGMRQYLESAVLREKVLQFWQQGKLIGAICHGILVLSRTLDPQSGKSVLYGHKLTALPASADRFGYQVNGRLLKYGYIMYDDCVEDEVRGCLARPEDFIRGRGILEQHAVVDGNLVTARWYGDAELFAQRFAEELHQRLTSDKNKEYLTQMNADESR